MTLQSAPLPFSYPIYSTSEAPGYANIQSTGNPLVIHLIYSCFTWLFLFSVKGLEPFPAYIAYILKSSQTSLALARIPVHIFIWLVQGNTNTSKLQTENISSREGSGGSVGWLRPGTCPVLTPSHPPTPLDITRLNQGTHCPTPDTSDLCHLICDASEWQRGKGVGWRQACCQKVSWSPSNCPWIEDNKGKLPLTSWI